MQLDTWTIHGRAFHFGKRGLDLESTQIAWPSDSLHAALISRLAALRGGSAVEAWFGLPDDPKTPPFLLTSAFPLAGDVRFFPLPVSALHISEEEELPEGWRPKELKNIRFISEALYRRLLAGESLPAVLKADIQSRHQKTVVLSGEERTGMPRVLQPRDGQLWTVEKRPRVAVGRMPNKSNLFHVGAVHFQEGCGLWFGLQWLAESESLRPLLEDLLSDLGDAGMGAERNAGYGHASIKPGEPLELPDPQTGLWTTLSRYRPAREEVGALHDPRAAYAVVRLGGWIDAYPLRRRPLHLLAEGAVLGPLDKALPFGSAADVRPDPDKTERPVPHPVWRSGYTVAVGFGGAA